ncbi:hypothetical protein FD755_018450 [Muntiacus reevesi]|uniref:Cyclin-dependent kinase 2-associated protein n=2 Tax=Muntiacus TaxID=9885 RepID=A0A5N3XBD6_MUNRE|nr:hypothetical protein FD754_008097 [Muntiacus muntjak]KAB0370488.1 hypothetical protein FD755_018450 [Muntiacus reevesi]
MATWTPLWVCVLPATELDVHPPSTSMATSSQYRQLLSDYGPPSLGYTQGTGNSQVPQSKYAELLAIIEELGKEIRPTYAGSKSAMERLKRETDCKARSENNRHWCGEGRLAVGARRGLGGENELNPSPTIGVRGASLRPQSW